MSHSDDDGTSGCWLSSTDPKHHPHLALMSHNRTRHPRVSAPDTRPLNSRLSFVCRHVRCFCLWERFQRWKHRLSCFLHARRSRLTEPEKAVRTAVNAECVTTSPMKLWVSSRRLSGNKRLLNDVLYISNSLVFSGRAGPDRPVLPAHTATSDQERHRGSAASRQTRLIKNCTEEVFYLDECFHAHPAVRHMNGPSGLL